MSRSLWPGFDPPTTRPAAPSESTEDKQCTLFVLCSQYVLFGCGPSIQLAPLPSQRVGFARYARRLRVKLTWPPEGCARENSSGKRTMIGKRLQFHDETWQQLRLLASESMKSFQELADEAFNDLLRKHGRPATLKEALRRSAGESAKVIPLRRKPSPSRRKR
jgi:hypothetical protein